MKNFLLLLAFAALTLPGSICAGSSLPSAPQSVAHKAARRNVAPVKATTPKPGSAERRAIMDALRVPVMKAYKQRVIFVVAQLRVAGSYAYLTGTTVNAAGKPVPNSEGTGGAIDAMLHKTSGTWHVLKWGSYGGTDLIDECRAKYPQAPASIYPF